MGRTQNYNADYVFGIGSGFFCCETRVWVRLPNCLDVVEAFEICMKELQKS